MPSKWEKFVVPIGVVAGIVGIWAALRKQAPGTSVNYGGNVAIPPIPALQQTEYAPYTPTQSSQPRTDPGLTNNPGIENPGQSVGTNPTYIVNAAQQPLAPSVQVTAEIPHDSYLSQNTPLWLDYSKFAARTMEAPTQSHGGCGCGGGKSSNCIDPCYDLVNPRLPDGHGECLTAVERMRVTQKVLDNVRYFFTPQVTAAAADVPYTYSMSAEPGSFTRREQLVYD